MLRRRIEKNDCMMFVTTNTLHREPLFTNPAYAREAVEHLYRTQQLHPFFLFGFVIMPDHCHFLLNIPKPETISQVMTTYKSGLAHQIGLGKIWQPRYDLRLPNDSRKVLEYIHQNPVQAKIVDTAEEYPWSSACERFDVTSLHSV